MTGDLTPAGRDRAITRARHVCVRFAGAVRDGNAHLVQRISDDLNPADMAALAVVLAAAADPGLLQVIRDVHDDDEGMTRAR